MKLKIKGPRTGEKFVFVFVGKENEIIVFNHWHEITHKKSELKVSMISVQLFLRHGLIHPPYTIYSNVIMIPVGASLEIIDNNFTWRDNFEYLDAHSREDSIADTTILQNKIANAFKPLEKSGKPIYIMQSAGKDSAAMLLGLKEAGFKDVNCLTYEANFRDRESVPAKAMANGLGFNHQTIEPDFKLEYELFKSYQLKTLGITGDFALIPYIHANSKYIKEGSIVIDGLGNDMYMGYVSPKIERILMLLSMPKLKHFEPFLCINNEYISYLLSSVFLHPYERLFPGSKLSAPEISKITGNKYKDRHNQYFDDLYKTLDKDDFRVAVRSRLCDNTMFQMKGELSSSAYNNEIFFPFTDPELVDYYFNLPMEFRYNKKEGINKVLLRKLIGEKIEIDDFFKVKSGFRYDMPSFISTNFPEIKNDILNCKLFNSNEIESWLYSVEKVKNNYVVSCKIYIVTTLATWFNANEFEITSDHIVDKITWDR